jgi:hypothetical protein
VTNVSDFPCAGAPRKPNLWTLSGKRRDDGVILGSVLSTRRQAEESEPNDLEKHALLVILW